MEQINTIELSDPNLVPDTIVLKKVLGESYVFYEKLLSLFEKYQLVYEWIYYKDGKAWLCKVQKKSRTIVWMSAYDGYIKATVYVPEKCSEGLYSLDIEESEKTRFAQTKNVGKSKPCMFDVKSDFAISTLEKIIQYKLKN